MDKSIKGSSSANKFPSLQMEMEEAALLAKRMMNRADKALKK
jgi:hypothetical protein